MSLPLPGHAIPYHFRDDEIESFLELHADNEELQDYIDPWFWQERTPWGMIIEEPWGPDSYGEILVYIDGGGTLHVVDVTNMSIVDSVKQAPFESPDSGFISEMQQEFGELFADTTTALKWGVVALVAIAALQLTAPAR